jgi:hypothetical protein
MEIKVGDWYQWDPHDYAHEIAGMIRKAKFASKNKLFRFISGFQSSEFIQYF